MSWSMLPMMYLKATYGVVELEVVDVVASVRRDCL